MKGLIFRSTTLWAQSAQEWDMSLRIILHKVLQHGRILFRSYRPHQDVGFTKINILPRGIQTETARPSATPANTSVIRTVGLQNHFNNARRLFVDNVLKRVTNSLAADLRRRTAKQLLHGNSAPFFALVGVSLASGTGILTKEDELDGVSWEIREAVFRMQKNIAEVEAGLFNKSDNTCLNDLEIGPLLAKGSNAVVYAARRKDNPDSPMVHMNEPVTLFPFAVKMMFNYDTESNAVSILRAMHRETVPGRYYCMNNEIAEWEKSMGMSTVILPPHPNIVAMHCIFTDRIPDIPGSRTLYPDALPSRINPDGYGRNMSLFLLMKRYDTSLKEYLSKKRPEVREGILLLAQLLEGVAHINKLGIAHRDLKSDNILLDLSESDACPSLVITDFGCCLADPSLGLSMPYRTIDTDKGGNVALMAPEVVSAVPGLFSYIDYSKSDVWAVGSIAYELLSDVGNPFYHTGKNQQVLRNTSYSEEELPPVTEEVPEVIARLVYSLLTRSPAKRPSAELAATVCQLFLWAPCKWLQPYQTGPLPSSSEILQWLLCLTTKVLCDGRLGSVGSRRTVTEYQLIASFLRRNNLSVIRQALSWIQQR